VVHKLDRRGSLHGEEGTAVKMKRYSCRTYRIRSPRPLLPLLEQRFRPPQVVCGVPSSRGGSRADKVRRPPHSLLSPIREPVRRGTRGGVSDVRPYARVKTSPPAGPALR
jgi:hypothetical protein